MNNSLRTRLTAITVAAMLASPAIASADTVSDLQAQIQSLMQQLKTLQEQLHQQIASSTPEGGWMMGSTSIPRWGDQEHGTTTAPGQWHMGSSTPCIALSRTLSQGVSGDDVKQLQQKLIDDGDLDESAGATGFFGPLTAAAVHKMQEHFGIASTTGTVGPMTREFLRKGCEDMMGQEDNKPGMMGRVGDMIINAFSSSTIPLQMNFGGGHGPQRPDDSNAISGSITSVDASSITVSDGDNTKTFGITDTTPVRVYDAGTGTMQNGTVASLAAGDSVLVHGMKTADGSLAAILIQKGLPNGPHMMMRTGSTTPPMHGNDDVLKMLQGFIQGGDNLDH